jgi:hypothetical protein
MKFFRSSRGAAYVAPPPAVIDPNPGRDAGSPPRTAIRPAPDAGKRPLAPGRVAPQPAAGASAPALPAKAASGSSAPSSHSATSAPARPSTSSASQAASAVPSPQRPADSGTAPPSASGDGAVPFERRPPQPLTIASHQLAIDLARSGDPVPGLARRYPHVLNQISAVWADLPVAAELIDDLLVDRRVGRRGFPSEVLAELLTVRRVAVKRMVGQPRKPARPQRTD